MEVRSVRLIRIFNSVGGRTFKAVINNEFSASAPSGLSRSSFESSGEDMGTSERIFRKIDLEGFHTQESFDARLDNSRIGNSAKTALSLAFFSSVRPAGRVFPHILGNAIGGGMHAHGGISLQEILVVKKSRSVEECVAANFAIWKEIGEKLKCGMGHESAWAPQILDEKALDIAESVASSHGGRIGIDAAASSFFAGGRYSCAGRKMSRGEHMDFMAGIARKYRLYYMEDPVHEADSAGYKELKRKTKALVCGDDLIATSAPRLLKNRNNIDAAIIKPNQAGTVTKTLEAISAANRNRIVPVVSHRSGETEDSTVSLMAMTAPLAKFGIAGIRVAKLNRLVELWHAAGRPRMARLPRK